MFHLAHMWKQKFKIFFQVHDGLFIWEPGQDNKRNMTINEIRRLK